MKILHALFQMHTGGAETMLADIVNEQVARGHEVELLIVNRGENEEIMRSISPEVKITRFNRTPGAAPLLLMARLNLFALRRRPDIIHLHMHKLTGLLRTMRTRTLFTVHALNIPMTYAAGSNMAAISDAVADDIKSRVAGAKVTVIPNGIRTDAIAIRKPGEPIHNPVRIIQVSRLDSKIKGQDILIRAIAQLRKRGIEVEATFIGEGPDLDSLQGLAREEGVANAVTFTGNLPRKEIYSRLADFDLMVQPSRLEGFGLTVAEGMAAGLPLIVPEGGGPWEVADRGRLAETFVNGDPTSCADAIERAIKTYPSQLKRAEEARSFVEANYSLKRQVSDYDRLYQKLLAGK